MCIAQSLKKRVANGLNPRVFVRQLLDDAYYCSVECVDGSPSMMIYLHSEMNMHDSHAIVTMMEVLVKMTFLLWSLSTLQLFSIMLPNNLCGP
jgi:hypothetical protein